MFVLGIDEFHKSSKCVNIQDLIVANIKGLGHEVMYDNEKYTSQACPNSNCHHQTVMAGQQRKHRVKYCFNCNVHFDRHKMAGENMIRIALSELNGNGRPSDLNGIYFILK